MLILTSTDGMLEQEWLELRRKGLGGSDVATAMGLSPWKSPMQLYLEKTGEIDPEPLTSEVVYWGTVLESVIADRFAELHPELTVEEPKQMLVHSDYPFMLANLDRVVITSDGKQGVLEVKTTSATQSDKWKDDNVPIHYVLQVQHYLAVTGYDFAYIACLIGGQNYVERYIDRDEDLIAQLIDKESEFWNCVETKTPPAWDGSEASWQILRSLYPRAEKGKAVELPKDLVDTMKEFKELEDRSKEYEAVLKDINKARDARKQVIVEAMADAEVGLLGQWQIKYPVVERKEYVSPATSYRRFSYKEVA